MISYIILYKNIFIYNDIYIYIYIIQYDIYYIYEL